MNAVVEHVTKETAKAIDMSGIFKMSADTRSKLARFNRIRRYS